MGTLANSEECKMQKKCYIMWHFISVCTVCKDKIILTIFLEIIICDPSMYTMDHPRVLKGLIHYISLDRHLVLLQREPTVFDTCICTFLSVKK